MIGSTIGAWKIERSLGRGAFGTVWAARGANGEPVVIKVLIPAISRDPAIRTRLKETWAELHQIDHPNIVQIRDVIERDADLCLVMEQVAGQTVEKLLSTGPLEPEEVLDLGRAAASALAAAHARGVIHRDITPANLYLGEGGVKVSNFGIALAVQEAGMMEDGFLPGTPLYMAPELFEGKPATPAVDVYALGLVLHRSLTRNASFRAPERSPGSRRVFIPEIPDIRRLCPGVGSRLAEAIRAALQRDPSSRPPNGSAMLQRLLEPGSTFEIGESSRPAAPSLPPQDLPFAPLRRPSLAPADLPPESRNAAFRSIPPPEAPSPVAPAPQAPLAQPEAASLPPVDQAEEDTLSDPPAAPAADQADEETLTASTAAPGTDQADEETLTASTAAPGIDQAEEETVFVDPFGGQEPTGEEPTLVAQPEPPPPPAPTPPVGFTPDLSQPVSEPAPAAFLASVAAGAHTEAAPTPPEETVHPSAPPTAAPATAIVPTPQPPDAVPTPESTATLPLHAAPPAPENTVPLPEPPGRKDTDLARANMGGVHTPALNIESAGARTERAAEKSAKAKAEAKPGRVVPKAAPAPATGSMNLVFLGGSLGFAAVVLCAGAWIVTRPKPPPLEPPAAVVEVAPPPTPAPAPAPAPEPPPERVLTPVLPPEAFLPPPPAMQASPLPANPRPAPAPAPGAKPPPPAPAPAPAPAAANPWGTVTSDVTVTLGVKKGATGVMVAVDGWDVGEAPYKATLQPGKHLIRWHKNGLVDLSCDINIPNRNVSYNVDPAKPSCP